MNRPLTVAALAWGLAGPAFAADVDNDGYDDTVDCNDHDFRVHPDATEVPLDGVDQDCDGLEACVQDADGDGYGVPVLVYSADLTCNGVQSVDDCDDTDWGANPGVAEVCGDGIDNDCDGFEVPGALYYPDVDADGYGDDPFAIRLCPWHGDPSLVSVGGDCDDNEPLVNPGRPEYCDGVDNDCNGHVDDEIPVQDYFIDRDGDGFGDPDPRFVVSTQCPSDGFSPFPTDCDDGNANVHPLITPLAWSHLPLALHPVEVTEADRAYAFIGDGIDQDCDGFDVCFADLDLDGFGAPLAEGELPVVTNSLDCDSSNRFISSNDDDCDDGDRRVFPGAVEIPGDGIDQDCDGFDQCFEDLDGDGFGSDIPVAVADLSCAAMPGASSQSGDCDDTPVSGVAFNPLQSEVCDGVDNDCNGLIDEVPHDDALLFYVDEDGDGFGVDTQYIYACGSPEGFAVLPGDCDDDAPEINPDSHERCANGVDDNCDGVVDDCGDTAIHTGYIAEEDETDGCSGCGRSYGHLAVLPLFLWRRRKNLVARVRV